MKQKLVYEIIRRDLPVVEIIWHDHHGSSMWTSISDDDRKLLVCHSVGYLVEETVDAVILANTYCQPPGGGPWNGIQTIAKKLIIRRKILSKIG